MKTQPRVLICAGHTGGHFFPALSCAEAFQARYPEVEIHFLLSKMPAFVKEAAKNNSFQFHLIPFSSIPPFFSLKMILFLLEYAKAFWNTAFLIAKLKPKLVLGFGSYSSVPAVLCASGLAVPVLLHEQNASFGRANQFLAFWASRVAISFPETHGKVAKHKVFYSGYPLRSAFLNHQDRAVSEKPFTILVFGGSQGARHLNQVFLESLKVFNTEEKVGLAVIHIVGSDDMHEVAQTYQRLGIGADVCSFSDRIAEYYQRANLVISRAGAGTIFELAAVGRAAILIPYPHAYAHQKINAEYLASQRSARMIHDANLDARVLSETIRELRMDTRQRIELAQKIKSISKPDASQILVTIGWELACAKN
ncbi:MAG: undecaprenyldiphospho-muramoylpentapeptide beta-N-acetylglucosaminyltransferase [Candidatus Omnitrophica bacterium]|nr:undecaprenyldiphospho-muramoylpentapeptide beta-N-acetylglucosaminyltransferase [Candidatus Omnitrophota bacterium]